MEVISLNSSNTTRESSILFEKKVAGTGTFQHRLFNLESDIEIIHDWVNRDYAKFWQMLGFSKEEVRSAYSEIVHSRFASVYIGLFNGSPAFLLECYQPQEDRIANYYDVKEGDLGMHILVGPPKKPIKKFTWHVFTVILDFIFLDEKVNRVVVEPDIRNSKIHKLNNRAGFVYSKIIELSEKVAHLAFCTRKQYYEALKKVN